MGEGYYQRKAREAREDAERRAREGREGVQQQADQAHSGIQHNTETSSLGSGQTQRANPTDLPVSGGSLDLVTMTVLAGASMLGAAAVAKVLGRKS